MIFYTINSITIYNTILIKKGDIYIYLITTHISYLYYHFSLDRKSLVTSSKLSLSPLFGLQLAEYLPKA